MEITILPELENLLPELSEKEKYNLEELLLANGCEEPLDIWQHDGKNILIDGHNRYALCQKNNISFQTRLKHFESIEDVKEYMMQKQLARRNLTDMQKTYFIGVLYEERKKKLKNLDNLTLF